MANVHVISGNLYPVLGLGPPKTGSGIVFLFCNTITWMIWEQSKFFILDQGEGDGRERGRGGEVEREREEEEDREWRSFLLIICFCSPLLKWSAKWVSRSESCLRRRNCKYLRCQSKGNSAGESLNYLRSKFTRCIDWWSGYLPLSAAAVMDSNWACLSLGAAKPSGVWSRVQNIVWLKELLPSL